MVSAGRVNRYLLRVRYSSWTLGVVAACLSSLAACRVPTPTTTPTPQTSGAATTASAPSRDGLADGAVKAAAESRADSGAGETSASVPLTTDDDVARTVVAVFGDSTALHPDSAAAADAPVWDLDVESYETHDRVAHYVRLFSTTGRDRFAARLSRGSRYEPMIRSKLRASGMPEDLTYLALIESGYDPHAYSRAAAVGMWQFMSGTARGIGMRVDWWVDERRDPTHATDGAIRFLTELQKQFGSLYLAAAAYNGGPGRVARGLTRFAEEMEGTEGDDRFFALAEQNYLRAETKNYVPQLIAAALVAKAPEKYGLRVDSVAPYAYDSVQVGPGTSLAIVATASGASAEALKDLNPGILRGIAPPDAPYWVHVPSGSAERARGYLDSLPADDALGYRAVRIAGSKTTPSAFAKREGVTLQQLRWFNPTMRTAKSGKLVAGQSLRIPSSSVFAFARDIPDPSIERYGTSATTLARGGLHVVKRGETLGGIAKRYRTTVARVQSLNGLRGTRVLAGQTLRVASNAPSVSRKSTAKKPVAKKSVTKKAVTKKPVKKPIAKKKPVAKSTAKSAVAKKPVAKTTAAKKPAAK